MVTVSAVAASLALAAVPLAVDAIDRWLPRAHRLLSNLAGGASLSYVFLYLLFQLTRDGAPLMHALLPVGPAPLETLFLVLLGAVAAFHILYTRPAPMGYAVAFWSDVVYNVMVGFALTEEALEGPLPLALYALALGLHLVFSERYLRHQYADRHRGPRRAALALSPLAGAVVALLLRLDPDVLYFPLAVVTGGLIIRVVQRELPGAEGLSALPFVVGLVAYGALILGTWSF